VRATAIGIMSPYCQYVLIEPYEDIGAGSRSISMRFKKGTDISAAEDLAQTLNRTVLAFRLS
jgi:hypothetical protein